MTALLLTERIPPRLLYVEDDPDHRQLTRESLQRRGSITVDFAENLTEADQHISQTTYDAILVDVDLDTTEKSGRQGDDWLRERWASFSSAYVAVVTAQKPRHRHAAWLRERHIDVVEKGSDEVELYDRVASRLALEPGSSNMRETTQHANDWTTDMLTQKTLSLFDDWVATLPDADVKDVWLGGRWLSPSDIASEMSDPRSPIGAEVASLFLDYLRSAIGLDKLARNSDDR